MVAREKHFSLFVRIIRTKKTSITSMLRNLDRLSWNGVLYALFYWDRLIVDQLEYKKRFWTLTRAARTRRPTSSGLIRPRSGVGFRVWWRGRMSRSWELRTTSRWAPLYPSQQQSYFEYWRRLVANDKMN